MNTRACRSGPETRIRTSTSQEGDGKLQSPLPLSGQTVSPPVPGEAGSFPCTGVGGCWLDSSPRQPSTAGNLTADSVSSEDGRSWSCLGTLFFKKCNSEDAGLGWGKVETGAVGTIMQSHYWPLKKHHYSNSVLPLPYPKLSIFLFHIL